MRQTRRQAAGTATRIGAAAVIGFLVLATAGCNNLLDVRIPGSVQASDLDNPGLAQTMVSSALGEFQCAYGMYVATTGILSEEYWVSGFTIGVNIWGWRGDAELRATPGECSTGNGTGAYGYYVPLQRARFLAEDASKRILAFPDAAVPGKTDKLAQLAAYAGYSYTLLGEGFCEMAIDNGPLMTRAQVWTKAEDWFTKAITYAQSAGNTDIKNMSFVGRARVRLDLGKGALAASDADSVPVNYVRNAEYSAATARRQNKLYLVTIQGLDLTVAPKYRGLTVAGVPDTRVPVVNANRKGGDGVTDQWNQQKYTALNSPVPLASWREAQLIIAEVRGGQAAINAMNAVRARANLPALTPAETADIPGTVVEERRRTLFSEGQRYNDMLRLGIPFPTGFNQKGQAYGSITCLPLPDVERQNNPNLTP